MGKRSNQFKLTIPSTFSTGTLSRVTMAKLRCTLAVLFVKIVYNFFVNASDEITRSNENVYFMATKHGDGLGEQIYATVDRSVYEAYHRLSTADRKYIISVIRGHFLKELSIIEERGEENYKPLGVEGISTLVKKFEAMTSRMSKIDCLQMEGCINGDTYENKIYRKENPTIEDVTVDPEH